jgi:sugar phosphate isomerase/epimerase
MDRKGFITGMAAATAIAAASKPSPASPFEISLSQWGFRRDILGNARDNYTWFIKTLHSDPDAVWLGEMDPRDIVVRARELGVNTVDPVNYLWLGHGQDKPWIKEFKRRAANEGVGFGVMMIGEVAKIGSSDKSVRNQAVEDHIRWMETAAELGCRFVRANPYGDGSYLEQCRQCAESLNRLGNASKGFGLDVLVENHGHPGSTGAWLAMLMEMTNHPRVGLFSDFDNFFMGGWNLNPERRYDRVQGLLDLAPYTRAVSAKSHAFDAAGNETTIDFKQCMDIFLKAGFRGLVSAEYEGRSLSGYEGSRATIALLQKVRRELGGNEG